MKKRMVAVALATVIITSNVPNSSTYAATSVSSDYAKIVEMLNLLDTDKEINSYSQTKITRAQFAQILCNLTDAKDEITDSNLSVYPDVRSTYWGANYIRYVVNNGYMTAYLNGKFKPNQTITLQEAMYSILKVLGYENSDFSGNLSTKVISLYKQKKLNTGITLTKDAPLTLDACTKLIYNTLKATNKQGNIYGEKFGCTLDSNGDISYLNLLSATMGDAIIATSGWQYELDGISSTTQFYLNDVKSTAGKIRTNDVLYYAENMDIVFAYRNRVTGTVQAINSMALRPQSVKIQDKEYTFATSTAASEFSIFGSVAVGDTVTLLLGKDNTIEGIAGTSTDSYEYTGIVTNYEENTTTITTTDYTVTVLNADGIEESYSYTGSSDSFSEGNLVNVVISGDTATVKITAYTATEATVNSTATQLGKYELADDIAILDYKEGCYANIYPSRLANVTLEASDILFLSLNEDNEIQELILNDVTGDLYSYGMVTGISVDSKSLTYIYDLNGASNSTSTSIASGINVPVGLLLSDRTVVDSVKLYSIYVKSLSDSYLTSTNQTKYLLSENCVAYLYDSEEDTYTYTSMSEIKDESKYTLTAYYDQSESEGGRVRLIIATTK